MSGLNSNKELFGEGSSIVSNQNFEDLNEKSLNQEMSKTLKDIRDSLRERRTGGAGAGAGIMGATMSASNLYSFSHGFGNSPNSINTPFEGNIKRMYPNAISAFMSETGINNFYNKEKARQNPLYTKFYNDQLAGDVMNRTTANMANIGIGGLTIAMGAMGGVVGAAALPVGIAAGAVNRVVQNNLRSEQMTHSDLMATSGGFMYGKADTSKLGMGMSRKDRSKIAKNILDEGYADKWWDHQDLNAALSTITSNKMLSSVRSAEDAGKKIKELTEAAKKVSTILGDSLEGSVNTMNKMRTIGAVDTKSMSDFSISMDRAKKEMGISRDGAFDIMAAGSQDSFMSGNGKKMGVIASKSSMSAVGFVGSELINKENYMQYVDQIDKQRKIESFEESKSNIASDLTKLMNEQLGNEVVLMSMMRKKKGTGTGTGKNAQFEYNTDLINDIESGKVKGTNDIIRNSDKYIDKSFLTVEGLQDFKNNKAYISEMSTKRLSEEYGNYKGLEMTLSDISERYGIGKTKDLQAISSRLSNTGEFSEEMVTAMSALIKALNEGNLSKELGESNRREKLRNFSAEYMKETSVYSSWHETTKKGAKWISDFVYQPFREMSENRKTAKEQRERENDIIQDEYGASGFDSVLNKAEYITGMDQKIDKEMSEREKRKSRSTTIFGIAAGEASNNMEDIKNTYNVYELREKGYFENGKLMKGGEELFRKRFEENVEILKREIIKNSEDIYGFKEEWIQAGKMKDFKNSESSKERKKFVVKNKMKEYEAWEDNLGSLNLGAKTINEIKSREMIEASSTYANSKEDIISKYSFFADINDKMQYKDSGFVNFDYDFNKIYEHNKSFFNKGIGDRIITINGGTDGKEIREVSVGKIMNNDGKHSLGRDVMAKKHSELFADTYELYAESGKGKEFNSILEKSYKNISDKSSEEEILSTIEEEIDSSGATKENKVKFKNIAKETMAAAKTAKSTGFNGLGEKSSIAESFKSVSDVTRAFASENVSINGRNMNLSKAISMYGGSNKLIDEAQGHYSGIIDFHKGDATSLERAGNIATFMSLDKMMEDGKINKKEENAFSDILSKRNVKMSKKEWIGYLENVELGEKSEKAIRERINKEYSGKDEEDLLSLPLEKIITKNEISENSKVNSSNFFKSFKKETENKIEAEKIKENALQIEMVAEKLGMGKVIELLSSIANNTIEGSDEEKEKIMSQLYNKMLNRDINTKAESRISDESLGFYKLLSGG